MVKEALFLPKRRKNEDENCCKSFYSAAAIAAASLTALENHNGLAESGKERQTRRKKERE